MTYSNDPRQNEHRPLESSVLFCKSYAKVTEALEATHDQGAFTIFAGVKSPVSNSTRMGLHDRDQEVLE